jgi:osmoprotectant transport system ATP-binding protein
MITFENVTKVYPGDVTAVNDLSFKVEEGETVVLLGSSGCGKTTTMKMVNRLIDATGGEVKVQGENVMDHDPIDLRRNIGYAIQHVGLFPHMTMAENVGIVPTLLGWDSDKQAERVDELLNMVGLPPEDYRDRYPNELSGGQRQRIGVARALAADPPIVLMDEPFGALDPITRDQLQEEFLDLESEIQKTVLFVTHDIFEAVKMGDRILLLDQGEMQQLSTPKELVDSPANEFVDQFLGQHRFQLSLLTRSIGPYLEEAGENFEGETEPKGEAALHVDDSLVEGLDRLKQESARELPVYKKGQRVGTLKMSKLLDVIRDVFGEAGTE